MPVLIVGSIALDHIKTPLAEHHQLLGGSASYAAVAASFFGPVNLVGVVGDDFPDHHRQLFADRKIDLAGLEIAVGKTFCWSGEYELNMNNRKTLSRSVCKQIRKPKFVVADTMDLWIGMARPDLLELLKEVDMLILNDSEAKQLTEEDNLIRAGRRIIEYGPRYVAVKKGEHGCLLFGRDGEFFSTGAFPLTDIADPTGAGDCFAGGFIGHLARTDDISFKNLKEGIIQGTLVASYCCEEFSLRRLQTLTPEEIQARRKDFGIFIS